MQLSKDFASPSVDASPRHDGMTKLGAQVAGRPAANGTTYFEQVVAHPSVAPVRFNSFDEAVRAAAALSRTEYDAGVKKSWLGTKHPVVATWAVLQAADGVSLLRTLNHIDVYDQKVGYIFRQWQRFDGRVFARSQNPDLLALVSNRRMFDFRGSDGNVVDAQPAQRG